MALVVSQTTVCLLSAQDYLASVQGSGGVTVLVGYMSQESQKIAAAIQDSKVYTLGFYLTWGTRLLLSTGQTVPTLGFILEYFLESSELRA